MYIFGLKFAIAMTIGSLMALIIGAFELLQKDNISKIIGVTVLIVYEMIVMMYLCNFLTILLS